MSEDQGRRAGDVDPATQLYVQAELGDTRHRVMNEIAALGAKVDLFSAQSTKEHAEVAGKLDRLTVDVAALQPLAAKVAALELADATAEATANTAEKLQAQSRQQFRWLVGLIVAIVPAAAAVVALVH